MKFPTEGVFLMSFLLFCVVLCPFLGVVVVWVMFLEGLVPVGVGMKRVFSGKAFGVRFPVYEP